MHARDTCRNFDVRMKDVTSLGPQVHVICIVHGAEIVFPLELFTVSVHTDYSCRKHGMGHSVSSSTNFPCTGWNTWSPGATVTSHAPAKALKHARGFRSSPPPATTPPLAPPELPTDDPVGTDIAGPVAVEAPTTDEVETAVVAECTRVNVGGEHPTSPCFVLYHYKRTYTHKKGQAMVDY